MRYNFESLSPEHKDSWRPKNRGDYENIGKFAENKCNGYHPIESVQQPGRPVLKESLSAL